jgi:hypothetical protein
MPEPTIKRRLTEAGVRDLARRRRPDLLHRGQAGRRPAARRSSFARSPDARGYVFGRKLELREEALRLGRDLLRGTKYEQER